MTTLGSLASDRLAKTATARPRLALPRSRENPLPLVAGVLAKITPKKGKAK